MSAANFLLRHSLLLLAVSQVSNISNVLFHMVMGRWLAPAEYGILVSMLALVSISSLPLNALSNGTAFFSAQLLQQQRRGDIFPLLRRWSLKLSGAALILLLLGLCASQSLAQFFKLPDRIPLVLALAVLALSFYPPIIGGALQGIQAFGWGSVSAASWGVIRLSVGCALVAGLGALANWALLSQVLGVLVSALIGLLALYFILRSSRRSAEKLPGAQAYLLRTLVVLGAFALLMNADILIVKHYFEPDASGLFARPATIARTIIYLPMPIAAALFPKTVSDGLMSVQHGRLLGQALLYTALLIIPIALLATLFPQVPLGILYHDWQPSAAMRGLLRATVWAMSPLSLAYIIMQFELSQSRFRLTAPLLCCAALYLLGVSLWHASLLQIVAVLAVVSILTLLVLALTLLGKGKHVLDVA